MIEGLFHNHVFLAAVAAWGFAQLLKTLIYSLQNRKFTPGRLVGDGGMPSGHSATVSAAAMCCAMEYGTDTPVFAALLILAIITCHDAMNSRRQIGEQAASINKILEELSEEKPEALEELVGHTGFQVTMGIVVGVAVAALMSWIFW